MMFDIGAQAWDEELLRLLRVPASVLPEVQDNAHIFGECDAGDPGPRDPDCGYGRRPAGGAVRAGVLRTGYDQIDLWHRARSR